MIVPVTLPRSWRAKSEPGADTGSPVILNANASGATEDNARRRFAAAQEPGVRGRGGHFQLGFDLESGAYFDGHFVTRESFCATKSPFFSSPRTETSRPGAKRSGTEPV
jgi:hypothetical protein